MITMRVKNHYDSHLGNFYSWMLGDFEQKQQEEEKFFRRNDIQPRSGKIAFDLGAGSGLQTISLARLGFSVMAVDFSKQLLDELQLRKGVLDIEIIEDDILTYLVRTRHRAELIACMGDTIAHLENLEQVASLIREMSSRLEPGGKIVLSFRDLKTELQAEERFIFVKSDDAKILTCFLEYFAEHVVVYDLLHEKREGKWTQTVSSYPKLRLNTGILLNLFQKNNIELLTSETINQMIYLIGKKQ